MVSAENIASLPIKHLKTLGTAAEENGDQRLASDYYSQAYLISNDDEEINIKYFRSLQNGENKNKAPQIAETYFTKNLHSVRLIQMYAAFDHNSYSLTDCLSDIKRALEELPDHSAVKARAAMAYCWHNDLERAAGYAKSAILGAETKAVAEGIRQVLARRFYSFGHTDVADWICRIGRVGKSVDDEILYDRLTARTSNGVNDPTTQRLFKKLLDIEKFARRGDLIEEYVDYRWRFDGPSTELVENIDRYVAEHPSGNNDRLLLMKISLLVQLGDDDAALSTLKGRIALKGRFRACLAVATLVHKHQLEPSTDVRQEVAAYANLYDQLARSDEVLRKRLSDEDRSIAVVGNSACEIGRGHGALIDSHDDVVRFNRFTVAPPYDQDYGRRVSILVRMGGDKSDFELDSDDESEKSLIIIRSASILYRGRAWRAAKRLHEEGHILTVLPPRIHTELCQILGGNPSSGISFVYLLHKLRKRIKREDFFGFSFTDQIDSDDVSAHYFEKAKPSFAHMWHKERALFDKIFTETAAS